MKSAYFLINHFSQLEKMTKTVDLKTKTAKTKVSVLRSTALILFTLKGKIVVFVDPDGDTEFDAVQRINSARSPISVFMSTVTTLRGARQVVQRCLTNANVR